MPASFIIPSIFSAVDQMSPKVKAMGRNVHSFAQSAEAAFARTDRSIRRIVPGLGEAQKQLLSMVGTGAAIAGAFQLGRFSFNSIKDYESAVDSFRVIVSDLNDTDFQKFQNEMMRVARTSKRSGIEVAQAFEKIAGINASFADTAEGLGQITEASITMAKAARMELGPAAENLVGIMNQFSFAANQADRTINVLAAGQAVGAASITQTAEAFTVFGSIAAGANISLEQSVGLIQTLGKYSLFGAEAGTKLRGSILRLQKAGIGYASGQFNVNDALNQTNEILAKMKTAKQKDAIINKLFGAENVTAGRILLNNIGTIKEFTRSVTGTSEAQKAAAINSGNLRTVLEELSAKWVNMLAESGKTGTVMNTVSNAAKWLTDNLETVVDAVITGVKWFAIYKTGMLATKAVLFGYNVVLGLHTGLTLANTAAIEGNSIAKGAAVVGERLLAASIAVSTGNVAAFNAALGMTPFGWAVLSVAALAGGIYFLNKKEEELIETHKDKIRLETNRIIDKETESVKKLVAEYWHLGQGIKEATVNALKFRFLTLNSQKRGSDQRIAATRAELNKEENIPFIQSLLFGKDYNKINQLNTQLAAQEQGGREISAKIRSEMEFMQAQVRAGIINPSDIQGLLNPVSKKGPDPNNFWASQIKTQQQNKDFRFYERVPWQELTVTVKNESDNPASVTSGKTKVADVMPKTQSTKKLNGR